MVLHHKYFSKYQRLWGIANACLFYTLLHIQIVWKFNPHYLYTMWRLYPNPILIEAVLVEIWWNPSMDKFGKCAICEFSSWGGSFFNIYILNPIGKCPNTHLLLFNILFGVHQGNVEISRHKYHVVQNLSHVLFMHATISFHPISLTQSFKRPQRLCYHMAT